MHIHMIQNGENLFSISSKYKLSASRLIEENQLASPYETLIGQSLICTHPSRMHTVKGGVLILMLISERMDALIICAHCLKSMSLGKDNI